MFSPIIYSQLYLIFAKQMPCIVSPNVWKWYGLAHVCLKWRHIVLASPHPLRLQLVPTHGRPRRTLLQHTNAIIEEPFPLMFLRLESCADALLWE